MLAQAKTASETVDVIKQADFAADLARRIEAGTAAVNDALYVKARAMRKLAGVVDEGQAAGEIATPGGDRRSIVRPADNASPLPVTRQRLAECRQIRDAFTETGLREVFDEATGDGREMHTKALIREAARQRHPDPVPGPVPLPDGVFPCIVIDPPWPMRKIERDERPHQGVALDYPVMSLDDIAKLPVGELAADDCHLYLWVTHKFLPAGLDLLEAWGFHYQCVMTWRKNTGITPFSWMYDTEHVLFARRGSLPLTQLGLRLSFDAPAAGHSVKPGVFYERVIAASPGPRLEMFARRERGGFTPWGNEVANA
jgi:N6-adenosine-specific RNA methylase IME4